MFYILNQNEQIAAADRELLEALELNNLQELCGSILTNEIIFKKLNTHKIDIIAKNIIIKASYEEFELSTTFGDVILIKLSNIFSKSIIENCQEYKQYRTSILKNENIEPVKQQKISSFLDSDIPEIIEKDVVIEKPDIKKANMFLDDYEVEEEKIIDNSSKIIEPIASVIKEDKKIEPTLDNSFHLKGLDLDSLINKEPIEENVKEEIIEDKKSANISLFEKEEKTSITIDEPIAQEEEEEFTPISLDDESKEEEQEDEISVDSLLLDMEEEEEKEEEFTPISLDDESKEEEQED